ncbi:hypothetical protein [Flavilitoribacter nigricans]|uniref:Uncharacterized protein n=1 Tax=Flavilitoribacter nigricans (strain ATCC 23147 / DSM 23189 / NBRC 102662 / NCIMB 1420 / SS-2) TaxID=1122177 RepID=A0A2D0MZ58_FLAN2|nr:hypothetical protein [Flavilitoribacter nigricans]PHN01564.1 hypothetical protein CRP01_36295 [Flavilitoribacter nigricans DSM 23189 = NBRC 102662]
MAISFLEKHSSKQLSRIQRIDRIASRERQPDFIHMMSINGREVAFLGDQVPDPDRFLQHFMRVDRMVIPQFAQMVNYDVLKQIIEKGFDDKAVSTSVKDLLYATELDRSILLDVCGSVSTHSRPQMNFHHCENFRPEKIAYKGLHSLTYGRTDDNCSGSHITSYFKGNQLLHKLVFFYLSAEDFKRSDAIEEAKYHRIHRGEPPREFSISLPIKAKLQIFFDEQNGEISEKPIGLDWEAVQGVFLLPMQSPNGGIIYQCILNVDGKRSANLRQSTKENLALWIDAMEKFNHSTNHQDQEFFIGIDDLYSCCMDNWSCSIAKNAYPVVGNSEELLLPEVLEGEVLRI